MESAVLAVLPPLSLHICVDTMVVLEVERQHMAAVAAQQAEPEHLGRVTQAATALVMLIPIMPEAAAAALDLWVVMQ